MHFLSVSQRVYECVNVLIKNFIYFIDKHVYTKCKLPVSAVDQT